MIEPFINCPSCSIENKLSGSLAAPLLAATHKEFEVRLAQKEKVIAQCEAIIASERATFGNARENVDSEIAEKLKAVIAATSAAEARKASLAAAANLISKARELGELRALLAERNEKLTATQKGGGRLSTQGFRLSRSSSQPSLSMGTCRASLLSLCRESGD